MVDAEAAYQAYAQSIGAAAGQLSKEQKTAALTNAVLAQSAGLITDNAEAGEDLASKFERMYSSIENAKDVLGKLFAPAVAAIAEDIANATVAATEGIGRMANGAANANARLAELDAEYRTQIKRLQELRGLLTEVGDIDPAFLPIDLQMQGIVSQDDIRASIEHQEAEVERAKALRDGAAVTAELLDKTSALSIGMTQGAADAEAMSSNVDHLSSGFMSVADKAEAAFQALTAFNNELRATTQAATDKGVFSLVGEGLIELNDAGEALDKVNAQLDGYRAMLVATGYSEEQIEAAMTAKTNAVLAGLRPVKESTAATREYASALSDLEREAERAFSAIESKVSSVLGQSLNLNVGVSPSDFLPREDEINENARRLADIMANGLRPTEWMDEFKNEVPDIFAAISESGDPSAAAAKLLQDFQAGLVPELIDKDMAKERVRRMILGEASMAEIANEIAQELSEEMGGMDPGTIKAKANMALGLTGPGTEAAGAFSGSAISAMESEDTGGTMMVTLTEQMRKSYSLLQNAGREGGEQWGAGFLQTVGDNIPPALVRLLTNLVTPNVMAQMHQQATLTGAE